ncbi:MAG: hypothetical protein ACHQ4H_17615 [Ktedonobacterales bacterium]
MSSERILPSPECATYGRLLALSGTDARAPAAQAATRDHLAGCARCRAVLTEYDALAAAARRAYGAEGSMARLAMPIRLEDVISDTEDDLPSNQLDQDHLLPPARRSALSSRRRPGRFALLGTLAAALVVAAMAGVIVGAHRPDFGFVPTGATPTLIAGGGVLIAMDSVPWGTLTVDGQAITADLSPRPNTYLVLGFGTGTHHLRYIAAPFPRLTCTFSVPAAHSDTCPLAARSSVNLSGDRGPGTPVPQFPVATRFLDLGAKPQNLPPDELAALVRATQHALDAYSSSALVRAGDHYARAQGHVAVATADFTATLNFVLPTQPVNPAGNPVCDPFCPTAGVPAVPSAGWHLSIDPLTQWQYTPPGGGPITSTQGPSSGSNVDIAVQWNGAMRVSNGAWQVTVSAEMAHSTMEENAMLLYPPSTAPGNSYASIGAAVATPAAAGAVSLAWASSSDQAHAAIVLYHNGAVVAANAAARQLFPTMAVASDAEATLAAQLARQLPQQG